MEVKLHFGLQLDKNDLQKVDDRLLFYALENSKDQILSPACPLFPAHLMLVPVHNVPAASALICWMAGQGLKQERSVWNWQSQSARVDEAPFATWNLHWVTNKS